MNAAEKNASEKSASEKKKPADRQSGEEEKRACQPVGELRIVAVNAITEATATAWDGWQRDASYHCAPARLRIAATWSAWSHA